MHSIKFLMSIMICTILVLASDIEADNDQRYVLVRPFYVFTNDLPCEALLPNLDLTQYSGDVDSICYDFCTVCYRVRPDVFHQQIGSTTPVTLPAFVPKKDFKERILFRSSPAEEFFETWHYTIEDKYTPSGWGWRFQKHTEQQLGVAPVIDYHDPKDDFSCYEDMDY